MNRRRPNPCWSPDPPHAPKQAPAIGNSACIILRQFVKMSTNRTTLLRYCQPCKRGGGEGNKRCPTPRTKPWVLGNPALVPHLGNGSAVEARARRDYRVSVPPQTGEETMFKGSLVALITPFRDGGVDENAFQELVAWQLGQGTHGLVPCGTTGETPALEHDEQR